MIYRIFFFTLAFFAIACNDTATDPNANARTAPKSPEDSLFKLVTDGHDVVMPKMGKVKNSLAQIQHILDSLVKLPEEKIDKIYRQSLFDLQEDLNYAEYGMNTWMVEFNVDTLRDNTEARMKYLKSEQTKVEKVRDNILDGLKRADTLLKQ